MLSHIVPLSYFSRFQRHGHGKIGFKKLSCTIAKNWKTVSDEYKEYCNELARQDRIRFERENNEYKATRKYLRQTAREQLRMEELPEEAPLVSSHSNPNVDKGRGFSALRSASEHRVPPPPPARSDESNEANEGQVSHEAGFFLSMLQNDTATNMMPATDPFCPIAWNSQERKLQQKTEQECPLHSPSSFGISIQEDPLLNVRDIVGNLDHESQDFIIHTFLHG